MEKIDKKTFKLIEFGAIACVGALALIGASSLIEHAKRAKQARIQHETLEYSNEKIQALIKEGYIPVATAEELNSIRSNALRFYGMGTKWKNKYEGGLDKKYIQVANIYLSEYDDWTPIGTLRDNFRGTYDGGKYVITGLEVKDEGKNYQGLFGRTEGAAISNVALENVNVTGKYSVGGLVGYAAEKTKISNSYATGSVTGGGQVGGLVGGAINSMISNSYFTGQVEGTNQAGRCEVGGLIGGVINSMISNSYSTGSVKGGSRVGGLVGVARHGTMISNSYSTGTVTGSSSIGGLVGVIVESTIKNSYAIGSVTGSGERVGGLVGSVTRRTNVYNSYWDKETTGRTYSYGVGTGKSTEEMKIKGTYEGWDFVDVWKIDEGNNYPTLRQHMFG